MTAFTPKPRRADARDLLYFSTPELWPNHPFLAVVRYKHDGEMECGVMYDARTLSGLHGYSATVFLTNIFHLPTTEPELLALPKEVFDTFEEMAEADWVVD